MGFRHCKEGSGFPNERSPASSRHGIDGREGGSGEANETLDFERALCPVACCDTTLRGSPALPPGSRSPSWRRRGKRSVSACHLFQMRRGIRRQQPGASGPPSPSSWSCRKLLGPFQGRGKASAQRLSSEISQRRRRVCGLETFSKLNSKTTAVSWVSSFCRMPAPEAACNCHHGQFLRQPEETSLRGQWVENKGQGRGSLVPSAPLGEVGEGFKFTVFFSFSSLPQICHTETIPKTILLRNTPTHY